MNNIIGIDRLNVLCIQCLECIEAFENNFKGLERQARRQNMMKRRKSRLAFQRQPTISSACGNTVPSKVLPRKSFSRSHFYWSFTHSPCRPRKWGPYFAPAYWFLPPKEDLQTYQFQDPLLNHFPLIFMRYLPLISGRKLLSYCCSKWSNKKVTFWAVALAKRCRVSLSWIVITCTFLLGIWYPLDLAALVFWWSPP